MPAMIDQETRQGNRMVIILFLIALVLALAGFAISFSSPVTAIILLGIAGILFLAGMYLSGKRKKKGSDLAGFRKGHSP